MSERGGEEWGGGSSRPLLAGARGWPAEGQPAEPIVKGREKAWAGLPPGGGEGVGVTRSAANEGGGPAPSSQWAPRGRGRLPPRLPRWRRVRERGGQSVGEAAGGSRAGGGRGPRRPPP